MWNLKIPNKVKICVWKAFQDILPSMNTLERRGIKVDTLCHRCNCSVETLPHALLDCSTSVEVWTKMCFVDVVRQHRFSPLADVLLAVGEKYTGEDLEVFCMVLWVLWWVRNQVVHGGSPLATNKILERAGNLLEEFQKSLRLNNAGIALFPENPRPTHWSPPSPGSLKLNTDAAINTELGVVGLGGVIRDEYGNVLGAFAKRYMGRVDAHLAESLAIRAGLVFALESGLRVKELESDALNVIQAIYGGCSSHEDGLVIDDINFLLNLAGGINCSHVKRECNMVAHSLAQFAFSIIDDCFWLEDYPISIESLVQAELASS